MAYVHAAYAVRFRPDHFEPSEGYVVGFFFGDDFYQARGGAYWADAEGERFFWLVMNCLHSFENGWRPGDDPSPLSPHMYIDPFDVNKHAVYVPIHHILRDA